MIKTELANFAQESIEIAKQDGSKTAAKGFGILLNLIEETEKIVLYQDIEEALPVLHSYKYLVTGFSGFSKIRNRKDFHPSTMKSIIVDYYFGSINKIDIYVIQGLDNDLYDYKVYLMR